MNDKVRVFRCPCGIGLRQSVEFIEPMRKTCANCGYDLRLVVPTVADAKLDTLEWLAECGHPIAIAELKEREEANLPSRRLAKRRGRKKRLWHHGGRVRGNAKTRCGLRHQIRTAHV